MSKVFQYLPTAVAVGPFDFNIKEIDLKEQNRLKMRGYFDGNEMEIACQDSGTPDQMRLETFMHELEHAINFVADLTDASCEEDFVYRGTLIRLKMLIDNPLVMMMLIVRCCDAKPLLANLLKSWLSSRDTEIKIYDEE